MKTNPHRALFTQHPLAQLALAFGAGIVTSNALPFRLSILLFLLVLLSFVSLFGLLVHRLKSAACAVLLALFFAGALLAVLERGISPADGLKRLIAEDVIGANDPVELTGVLDGPPEFARDRIYLPVKVASVRIRGVDRRSSGKVILLASFQTPAAQSEYLGLRLRYGARLRVMTLLDRSDTYRNPGVSSLTEYLDRKGYDATGFVKSALLIERLDDERVFLPLGWLYDWRRRLQLQIDSCFSPETAGVLDASMLGNRYNLPRTTTERFRVGGTFHVLVISGLHISFIGGIVFVIARRLSRSKLLQFLVSTTVLWCYALAVGADASVVRAGLMFTFVALAAVVFRHASSLNALGAAALALLIWSPQEIFDPSLQLTFMSVLAIVVIAWPLLQRCSAIGSWRPTRLTPYPPACVPWLKSFCEALFWSERNWQREIKRSPHSYKLFKSPVATWLEHYHVQKCARYTFGAVLVSVCVQVMLLPFLIVYFHRLSLASVVLNIVVSLLLAALAVVAAVALATFQISAIFATPLFRLANALDWLMVHSVDPFAHFGVASLRLAEYSGPPAVVYAFYYFPLVLLVILFANWQPLALPQRTKNNSNHLLALALAVQLGMLALIVVHPLSAGRADGKLHIDFLDVGQGDSALVTMPDGTTLLVDGGGRPSFKVAATESPDEIGAEPVERETRSIGETVVSEYLWWRGLDQVDYVLATHADADHIDGLNDVLRNFTVRSALVGRTPGSDPEYARFAQTLVSTRTPVAVLQAGDLMRFGNVEVSVLWPQASADCNAPSRNNDSVVLRFQLGERAILLTGDIEKRAEADMLRAGENLRVDVVKVPHHGSKTSSTESLVLATQSRLAIISVGQVSMFGHPHREVVERWNMSGAEVLTTGKCGTITVTTDGSELKVAKFVPQ